MTTRLIQSCYHVLTLTRSLHMLCILTGAFEQADSVENTSLCIHKLTVQFSAPMSSSFAASGIFST